MLVKVSGFEELSESQGKVGRSDGHAQGAGWVGYQRLAIATLCQCLAQIFKRLFSIDKALKVI